MVNVSFHRPALFAGHEFSAFRGGDDPAAVSALAHETAARVLAHVRGAPAEVVDRAIELADENGLDLVAELWSQVGTHTLPGSLWQLYLLRAVIRERDVEVSHFYQLGTDALPTADPVIAGAPTPAGPHEVRELADRILHGAFTGDFGHALERSAAFCRVVAAGALAEANASELVAAERSAEMVTFAARLTTMASQCTECARLWRAGRLS